MTEPLDVSAMLELLKSNEDLRRVFLKPDGQDAATAAVEVILAANPADPVGLASSLVTLYSSFAATGALINLNAVFIYFSFVREARHSQVTLVIGKGVGLGFTLFQVMAKAGVFSIEVVLMFPKPSLT